MFLKIIKKENLKLIKLNFTNAKLAAAFHNQLTLKQQSKIKKFIKRMQFPCFDALTYCQLAEGRLEMVAQCANKDLGYSSYNANCESSRSNSNDLGTIKTLLLEEILLFQIIKPIIKRF